MPRQTRRSNPLSFHKFTQLPLEIRQSIWQYALDDATAGRIIHVSLDYHNITTFHYCWSRTKEFCGQDKECNAKIKRHQDWRPSQNMSDGFFYCTICSRTNAHGSCHVEAQSILSRSASSHCKEASQYYESVPKGMESRRQKPSCAL